MLSSLSTLMQPWSTKGTAYDPILNTERFFYTVGHVCHLEPSSVEAQQQTLVSSLVI